MPTTSLDAILDHGFEKGSKRVGRTQTLDEAIKAELVVNAHIRHNFTAYDSLYATMKTTDNAQNVKARARIAVYDQVKRIAQSWRCVNPKANAKCVSGSLQTLTLSSTPPTTVDQLHSSRGRLSPTPCDADTVMEDVENNAIDSPFDETQGFLKPLLRIAQRKRMTRRSREPERQIQKVATAGVRKRLRAVPMPPTRIQPKRGLAALDEALASMGLNEAAPMQDDKQEERINMVLHSHVLDPDNPSLAEMATPSGTQRLEYSHYAPINGRRSAKNDAKRLARK